MNASEPIVVAVVGYLGVITSVVGQLYVANKAREIEDDLRASGGAVNPRRFFGRPIISVKHPTSHTHCVSKRLNRLEDIRAGLFACLLLCLVILGYILFQPGEENEWFAKIHIALSVYLAGSCVVLLVLLGLGRNPRIVPIRGLLYFIVVMFGVDLGVLIYDFVSWQPLAPNEKLTFAAWDGFNSKRYGLTIAASEECVHRFGGAARRLESSLASTPEPPLGRVADDEKMAIFENGVLNDVATCYWIKGGAEENNKDFSEARSAYVAASKLVHARTFDPNGNIFFSPAQDAKDRLDDLK